MPADQTPRPPSDDPRGEPPRFDAEHPGPGRIRSSSAERERIASILRAAAEAGLLTLDEADERMAACYQSQFRDELAPLVADLPNGGRGLIPPDPEEQARERRTDRDDLLRHFTFVGVVSVVLIGIWAIAGAGFFWPAWPLGFLALTLVFHAKHRKHRRIWREHLREHGGRVEFRAHRSHGCGRGSRGQWWAEEHSSRTW
ncbi:DUF1707 domain-containing protein [Cryptosporangium aurantiacum]|uniref:DUF1707 domain-containing protein n=1 Tax=Cryptosporangium aurantiacum TaxID=134849 RepID=A0A1M7MYN2_9ACTN|nr:DUF1707 domain-containing protein [Cryptosporangium aurantiacum]SHM95762.1 protein of unknown function [Cryptosporangium aurantiacum]